MLRQAERGEPIPAFRGEARTWCWIGDIVRGIRLALESGEDGVFNIGTDADPVALIDAARLACELAGASEELIREVEPPPGRVTPRISVERLRALGWQRRGRARGRHAPAARIAGERRPRREARAFVLIGGSRSQLGLLEHARALGHEVCVVDGSESAPLLAEADIGIVRSFTEVDRVLDDLEAQGIEPAAVATMGSDQAVLPTARLAERLGLPGFPLETAKTVADKRRMRKAFERHACAARAAARRASSRRQSRRSTSSARRSWSSRSTARRSAA